MNDPDPGLFNFTSVPDGYRQYLQPVVFDPWARELLAFVPPSRGDVVLDVRGGGPVRWPTRRRSSWDRADG